MTNSFDELEEAGCIFVIGSNTTEAHPLIADRILRAKQKGAILVVADPRRIHLAEYADIHVRQRLGSDVALINGIMNVILAEGWQAADYIAERCEAFDELEAIIKEYPPERAAEISGVDAETIRAMAKAYATAESSSIVYAMGITQHTTGVDNVKSLANLAMLCGRVGAFAGGVNPLRGQNNVQGACDMGGLPNVYPGYQKVVDQAVAEKFGRAWNAEVSIDLGRTIMKMVDGILAGEVEALYVLGENPALSDPNSTHVREALDKVPLLVVQDIVRSETAEYADVVLPGCAFAEKDGTFTNSERRVQLVRKAVERPGEARDDSWILCEVSSRMGYAMEHRSAAEVFDELASLTPQYAGMSYPRLQGAGLQWPCPAADHPGTPYLHKGKFARGQGLFHAIEYKAPAEGCDADYPLQLTTGRSFVHFHTGTMTRQSPSLDEEQRDAYVEVHPDDAVAYGVQPGQPVRVSTRRGSIELEPQITERVGRGVIFIPFHFAEAAANILTIDALDPIAGIPEYKVCAVKIEGRPAEQEAG